MKTRIEIGWGSALSLAVWLMSLAAPAVTNDLSATLSKGLFEEEANHNLGAAIQMYQSVIDRFDTDRKLAATAVFRLGECYRKQGSTNEASAQYQRVLREFADQSSLVELSRKYLAGLGGATVQDQSGHTNLPRGVSQRLANVIDLGEIGRVQNIIQNSPDLINAPDASGQTLLQTYAGKGDLAAVELLLQNGAAVNGIKQPDLTPLHFAAGNGHKSVVELLLSKGAKVDAVTSGGVTPLHLAVLKGYELVAKDLLGAGANVNAAVTGENSTRSAESLSYYMSVSQTPLHLACEAGYLDLVQLLISKGADVNAQDAKGRTALTIAAAANNDEMVNILLTAHADPNAGRSSALTLAAGQGNVAMLELLVSKGAKVNLSDALREAVSKNHPAAVAKLIQLKADPDTKSTEGNPLAFYAMSDTNLLRVMLDGGADPNARDSQGDPLLYRVAGTDETGSLELLLSHGADPNVKEHRGFTPLHYAALNSRMLAARALLEHGANVNAQSDNGETPLFFAVRNRHAELARLLLEHGADPNLQDKNGQTPLDIARQLPPGQPPVMITGSQITLADYLVQHGARTDLPRMDRIEIRRLPYYSVTIFSRSTNDVNRFSVLELLAVEYGFVSTAPIGFGGSIAIPSYDGHSRTIQGSLRFPDLQKIEIRRPKPDGKEWTTISVPVQNILDSGDCSRDVWLEWGDQVEIPEADHPLDAVWTGFPEAIFTNLQKCVQRTVHVIVKGQTNTLTLEVPYPGTKFPQSREFSFNYSPPQFFLSPALQRSGLLRSSSDLRHIKVTRHNSAAGENWEKTFDCSGTTPLPSLWLREGDVIEVPDKPV
ncbi:MAG TPA: ankyrin repeat domain-containing protein [Verrucomicrobiae bacterium]|nr:ankyrin repeat domain-containing protein [Verrucomicrobiae bacterium]